MVGVKKTRVCRESSNTADKEQQQQRQEFPELRTCFSSFVFLVFRGNRDNLFRAMQQRRHNNLTLLSLNKTGVLYKLRGFIRDS